METEADTINDLNVAIGWWNSLEADVKSRAIIRAHKRIVLGVVE